MKEITFDREAWTKLQNGINQLANAVKSTLGPGGATVLLQQQGSNLITKDGVTVARHIALPEPIEDAGCQTVKEAASKTAELAGDGTTTSIVLAQTIFNAGFEKVKNEAQRNPIKRGLDAAVKDVTEQIKAMSQPVELGDVFKVAKIAANGDEEIANLINDSVGKVGKEGLVQVEDSKGRESYVKLVEGVQFDRGYISPYFVTNQQKMRCDMENVEVLIFDGIIEKFKDQLLPLLEKRKKRGYDLPILIVCEDLRGEAQATTIMNTIKNPPSLLACAVQSPDFGDSRKEILKDLSILTGAKVVSKEAGLTLEKCGIDVLGTCKKAQITQWTTTIIEGGGKREDINARAEVIRSQMEDANPAALQKLKDRLGRLLNGMAVIVVGGLSEVAINEKKDRIDDALRATKAALEEGVIIGGGMAYVRIHERIKESPDNGNSTIAPGKKGLTSDELIGYDILIDALRAPFLTIVDNIEENPAKAYKKVTATDDPTYGFNAKTRMYENLIEAGVLDATKVVRLALENAASVAGTLLTTKTVVSFIKPKGQ